MKTLNCIIVDDEPLAQDVIKKYVMDTPYLSLLETFENAWQLQAYLVNQKADLIFLDIQMPGLDGLTFMKTIHNPPAVIFITAFREYAVEAFDVSAKDYLLKPVSYDRFLRAVNKVASGEMETKELLPILPTDIADSIFVLVDRQMKRLMLADILYLEAQGDYIKIHLLKQPVIMTKKTLREMVNELPADVFIQIHRSFVVHKSHISAFTNEKVLVDNKWLKISRSFKGELNL